MLNQNDEMLNQNDEMFNQNDEMFNQNNKKDLIENITHYVNKIKQQEIVVANRKQSYDYLYNKINDVNKDCPVCMNEIENNNSYDVPECGHILCTECMNYWLADHSSCTVCRKHITRSSIYTITNMNQVKLKYSTKIDTLLNIIKKSDNNAKFIVYTQFDNLITKLYDTLNMEHYKTIKFETSEQIDEFKTNPLNRVLIISSIKNASGIDLSFVSNIVIFEPIKGDTLFTSDIEKQIIGRLYRINQTQDINIYRLIIKKTIEEEIFNKSKQLKIK